MSGLGALTVPPSVADAWRWWTDELGAMLPAAVHARAASRPRSTIIIGRSTVAVERIVDGLGERHVDPRPLAKLDADAWSELAALIAETRPKILLEPPEIHVARLVLPLGARGRLDAAVALRLDEIAPLDPELLVWTVAVTQVSATGLVAAVAMVRASMLEELQLLFEANGLAMPSVAVMTGDREIVLMKGADGSLAPEQRLDRRSWLIAAALLASIPFTTLGAAKIMAASTEARIATSEQRVQPKLEAERRWQQGEALRRALRPVLARPSASATIELLANTLPQTATAYSVEQAADRSLTIIADTPDAQALAHAMASASQLPGAKLVDETAAANGALRITYRTASR